MSRKRPTELDEAASPIEERHALEWRRDGVVLVPGFFGPAELRAPLADFATIYQPPHDSGHTGSTVASERVGAFRLSQFTGIRTFPFSGSSAINLLPLHQRLLATARLLLQTSDVFMYLAYTWAKFAGESDFEQAHHLDYATHTLLVPEDDPSRGTLNVFLYLSDVTDDLGATHYVPRSSSREYPLHKPGPSGAEEQSLRGRERSAAGPAGSALLYRTDVYHRGTNLTRPGGHRYVVAASYRRADTPWAAPIAWLPSALHPAWQQIFAHASADQLAALGIPRPGERYWTLGTIDAVEARYPAWRSTPWRIAAGLPPKPVDRVPPRWEWPTELLG